jgi:hypothetical protein
MKLYLRYIIIWLINSILILLANYFWPTNYVLGNAVIPPVYAALFAGFLLTIFCRAMKPVIKRLIVKERSRYVMFGVYWFVNFAGIWIIARLSFLSGFGISAFYYAIVLGFAANFGQWLGRQLFKTLKML